jgi:catechol 2,3-dioxygenase-like lactoylglutathione lyase family enzyme
MAIGRLYEVVIDCPDPQALAAFYAELTGLEAKYSDDDWVTLGAGDGVRVAFQRVANHRPPQWPDPAYPQHAHLDVFVADLADASAAVLALGATQLRDGETSNVYADPAGHPFCLAVDDPSAP